jgi:hypothetical protein
MEAIFIAMIIGIGLAVVGAVIAWIKAQTTIDNLFSGRHF